MFEIQAVTSPTATSRDDEATAGTMTTQNGHDVTTTDASTIASTFKMTAEETFKSNEALELHSFETNSYNGCSNTTCDHLQCSKQSSSHVHESVEQICPPREVSNNSLDLDEAIEATVDTLNHQQNDSISNIDVSRDSINTDCASLSKKNTTCDGANDLIKEQKQENNIQYSNPSHQASGYCNATQGACGITGGDDELNKQPNKRHWNTEQDTPDDHSLKCHNTDDSQVTDANANQTVVESTRDDSLASPSYELLNSTTPGHFPSTSSTSLIEPADEVVPGTSDCHGYNIEAALTTVQANVKLPGKTTACTDVGLGSNLQKSCDLSHGKSSSTCTQGDASCRVAAATSMNITSDDQSTKSVPEVSSDLNLFNRIQDVFSKRLYPGDSGCKESTFEPKIGQLDRQEVQSKGPAQAAASGASETSVSSEQNRELTTVCDATAASVENGSISASGTSWKSPNTSTTSHILGEPVITMPLPVTSATNANFTSILGLNNNEMQVSSSSDTAPTCPTLSPFNGESSLTCDGDHGCSKDISSSVIQATRDSSSSPCSCSSSSSSSSTPSPSWTPSSLISNCNGSAADGVNHSARGEEKGEIDAEGERKSNACKVASDEVNCYNLEQIKKLPGEDILFTGQTLQGMIALTRYRLILLNNATIDQVSESQCTTFATTNGKTHNGLNSTYATNGESSHVQVNGHSEEHSTDSDVNAFEASQKSQSKTVTVSNEPESKSNCSNGLTSVAWVKNGETSCSKIDLNHSTEVKNHSTNNGLNNRYNRISLPIGIIDFVEIREGVTLHFLTKFVKCYKCDFASSDAASSWMKKVTDAISYASKLDHLFCFHHWKSTVSLTNHAANGLTNGGLSNGSLSKLHLNCQKQVTLLSNGIQTNESMFKESADQVDGSIVPPVIPTSVNGSNSLEEEKDSPYNSSLHVNASGLNNIDEDKVSLASSLSLISLGNLDCATSNSTLRVSTTSLTSNHSTTSSTIASTTTTATSAISAPLSSSVTTTTTTNLATATNTSPIMSTATSSIEATAPSVNTSVNIHLNDPLVKKSPSSMLHLLLGTCLDRVSFEFNRMSFGTYPDAWRITEINSTFTAMPTYPQYLIVPGSVTDSELEAVSNFRAFKRIPTIVWRSQKNGCVIARSGQPEVGWFGWREPQDERMITEITTSSFAPVSFSSKKLLILDARSYAAAVANRAKGGGCECNEYYTVAEVQFMGLANIHSIRKSFQAIRYVCQFPGNDANGWSTLIDSSKWLHHIAGIIKSALVVVDAISVDERPVLVHCSDGWDRTPQIIALAEMLLDPFYRTFDGFQLLIQKEWIEFGHKFADRCGSAPATEDANERCPVFLQWIDCVHQLIKQFPADFEFNLQFLIELIIHVHSCLFGTFTCNNMNERSIYNVNERSHSFWTSINENKNYFLNSHYAPTDEILRPSCDVVEMIFWNEVYAKHSISSVD